MLYNIRKVCHHVADCIAWAACGLTLGIGIGYVGTFAVDTLIKFAL